MRTLNRLQYPLIACALAVFGLGACSSEPAQVALTGVANHDASADLIQGSAFDGAGAVAQDGNPASASMAGDVHADGNAAPAAMRHRGYLGWIGDLRRTALTGVTWPSIAIDDTLMADYIDTLDALAQNGQNEITLWGFFTNDNWSSDVTSTIDGARATQVRSFIAAAHARGIRILSGVGVYSWGFANIIAAHPEVRCATNARVMSLASAAAWDWQKRVLDFVLSFPFDGVSLQSADLGRCNDGSLAQQSDASYHADLNVKCAAYVKAKDPQLLVGVSGWGMNFGIAAAMPDYVRMAKAVDYVIDVGASALGPGRAYRKGLVQSLAPAAFGTIGSPNVEPIQHYPRDRYFIPTLTKAAQAMADVYADGGQAMETYARTRGNVGDEASMELLGELESAGFGDPTGVLRSVLARIYQPMTTAALDGLAQLFLDGETAFFMAAGSAEIILVGPRELVSFDLHKSTFASWSRNVQISYRNALSAMVTRAETLAPSLKNQMKATALVSTLRNAASDLTTLAM